MRAPLFAFALLAAYATAGSAQSTDVVHGRVVAADSSALAGAVVTVVDTIARVTKPARTNSAGAFSISFDAGRGTYLVSVAMLGYAPQRRVVVRAANGSVDAVNFRLSPIARQLGAVRSVGERPKVARTDISGDNSVGGSTTYTSLSNGLTGDVTGDLGAILATLPGVSVTLDGSGGTPTVSAFGIGSDQNGLTLNGLSFGAQVPRDGFRLAVLSSSYDPSQGKFAGVQLSLRMQTGNNIDQNTIHGTLDAPSLQWTSPIARQLGNQSTRGIVSGALSGPIVRDKLFYSGSYQLTRQSSNLTSLESANPAALEALRVDPDSIAQLFRLLKQDGIPLTTSRVPDARLRTEGIFAARLDFDPHLPPSAPSSIFLNTATYDDYYLQVGGTVRDIGGQAVGVTSLPSSGSEQTHRDGYAQFTAAKYLPRNILNEASFAVAGAEDRINPYLDLPSARILIASELGDGTVGLSSAQVGGTGSARVDGRTWSGELRDQLLWNSWDRHHSLSITLDATADGYSTQQDAGFGTFTFNSLGDFAAGLPASYLKTLTAQRTSGTGFNGAVGLGDTYIPIPPGTYPPGTLPPSRPVVQYGVRIEGNGYGFRPEFNPAVDSIFHLRTDNAPRSVGVSPMVGFNWPIFPEFRLANGSSYGRRGSLSGGIREYRGMLTTQQFGNNVRQTGLPDAIQQLYCVGSAAPSPDWQAFDASSAAVPTQCANGAGSALLAQTGPQVTLYAPGYRPLESWRPELKFAYRLITPIQLVLSATDAINRDVGGVYDVNFNSASRMTLADEGNRPVYVSAASIVDATGAEAWTESRVSPAFAHVSEIRSSLHAETRTVGATLNYAPPAIFVGHSFMTGSLGYAFNDGREQTFGFGATTAANPAETNWSRSATARHVVTFSLNRTKPGWGSIGLFGRLQSGQPYTPVVRGDINGDGYSNDAAFVFNPLAAKDTSVASSMAQLLRNAPSTAKVCLTRQLGTVAGRNSCAGPWSIPQLNFSISPESYRIGLGNRGTVQLLVSNVLSGLDQALHGDNKLHGWGQFAFADPTLLTVRGFDPVANRFQYTVNPLFGSSAAFRNTFRRPFMLTLDVRLGVGPDLESQYLNGLLRVRAADGGPLTEQQIKGRIAGGINPINQFVQVKDSLQLTPTQLDSLSAIARRLGASRDSIVGVVARFLVNRHGDYTGDQVRQVWHAAGIATYEVYISEVHQAIALLSPAQHDRLTRMGQLQGFVNLETIRETDLPFLLRTPLAALP